MGEMDNNLLQFFYNGKPIQQGDFGCGSITKPSSTNVKSNASIIADLDATIEKYDPTVDEFWNKISKCCQKPIKLLTEETAQQLDDAFKDLHKTMNSFPSLPPHRARHKARKHYKPKFTL